jgi:hypothetical protein
LFNPVQSKWRGITTKKSLDEIKKGCGWNGNRIKKYYFGTKLREYRWNQDVKRIIRI